MWILPKQLHTSPFVPATEALISDLNEQSQACAQSLLVRSKPSPARTWSLKWKRDSWTQLLSGRILKPSHGQSFTAAWTSSLAATRASHSAQLASASAPKTPDTSGHLSQPELLSCDQVSVSLKTSRDISALGFPTCCKTWPEWVTERRGAWRQRVNAARLTRGRGFSSWRTPTEAETHNQDYSSQTYLQNQVQPNWPTVCASEVRQGFQDRSRGMKGSQESLTTAVILHGQAAPASSSLLGSRQGLSVDWRTPQANEAGAKVETLFTKDGSPAMPGQRAYRKTPSGKLVLQSQTINQQVEMVENWATPQAHDAQGPKTPEQIAVMRAKGHGVKNLNEMVSWATPQAKDHKSGHRDPTIVQYKQLNVEVEARATGKLNPRWVETLMGLPIGWTMPSCASPQTIALTSCDSSAMELCLPPQSELSEFSLAS